MKLLDLSGLPSADCEVIIKKLPKGLQEEVRTLMDALLGDHRLRKHRLGIALAREVALKVVIRVIETGPNRE